MKWKPSPEKRTRPKFFRYQHAIGGAAMRAGRGCCNPRLARQPTRPVTVVERAHSAGATGLDTWSAPSEVRRLLRGRGGGDGQGPGELSGAPGAQSRVPGARHPPDDGPLRRPRDGAMAIF